MLSSPTALWRDQPAAAAAANCKFILSHSHREVLLLSRDGIVEFVSRKRKKIILKSDPFFLLRDGAVVVMSLHSQSDSDGTLSVNWG